MRMKYFTVAFVIMLVVMGGCEKPLPPDTILSNCLDALVAGNVTEAYEYFSYDDQLTVSKEEFIKQLMNPRLVYSNGPEEGHNDYT